MKRLLFWSLAGVSSLLLLIPPLWLYALPEVQADGLSGSHWQGRASALGVGGVRLLQDVHWRWDAAGLLRGELRWQLEAAGGNRALLVLDHSGVRVRDARLQLPLAPLASQQQLLNDLRLDGELLAGVDDWRPGQPLGLRLQGLQIVRNGAPLSLGACTVQLQGDRWTVSAVPGSPLALSGTGQGRKGSLSLQAASPAGTALLQGMGYASGVMTWSL
ncbi:type II secretion system protein N [Chitinilyticum aquatile]|uniref:type II secretion system protein N n=1 Tax=Chitinilyticum aquatile TaxID=362520 RepID=UPI00138AD939|nr:type II secretion system protein N [Chitinilyticum aquatile]